MFHHSFANAKQIWRRKTWSIEEKRKRKPQLNNTLVPLLPHQGCNHLITPKFSHQFLIDLCTLCFSLDLAGVWNFHCHIERHMSWGMMMAFITENGEGPTATLPAPKHRLPQCKFDPNPWVIVYSTDLELLAKDWIGIQAFLIWCQEVANFGVLRLFFCEHFDSLQRGSIAFSMIPVSLWNKLADHLSHNSCPLRKKKKRKKDLVPIESVYYKLDLSYSIWKVT